MTTATSAFASRTHRLVDRIASAAHEATDTIAGRADRLTAAPTRVRDAGLDYLRANALAAVAIAFCAGWVIGRLGR